MELNGIPPSPCTKCGTVLSRPLGPDTGIEPEPGHYSFCFLCGNVMVFDDGLRLRTPTAEEIKLLRSAGEWPVISEWIRALEGAAAKAEEWLQ